MVVQLKTEQLKAVYRQLIEEAWNQGELAVLDELFDANIVAHRGSLPGTQGAENYKQYVADFRRAFPDGHITIHELIAEGNTVVARFTIRGTHRARFPDIPGPPTDKQVTVTGCDVVNFTADGRVAEIWDYPDALGMLQQLGVIRVQPPA
jgi:steroid delta-isomerase-like uncharacterized protein